MSRWCFGVSGSLNTCSHVGAAWVGICLGSRAKHYSKDENALEVTIGMYLELYKVNSSIL